MRTLTNRQARDLLLRYQGLDGADGPRGLEGARAVLDRLGTIQYDPLNVAGRNADLVLQARVRGYRPEHLHRLLYRERFLVDGYDKEMCIYTARDFGRFGPVRGLNAGEVRDWLVRRGQGAAFERLDEILETIRQRGPMGFKDAGGESQAFGWGPRRVSGAAIEYLFRAGRLCIAERQASQRLFDLSERTLPGPCLADPGLDAEAFADWYVLRRVGCVGLLWARRGGAWQGYVVSRDAPRKAALARLADRGRLVPCRVEDRKEVFYALPEALALLDRAPRGPRARFIAPLDNLLWDRDMLEALFAFRYRWEVYTPASKRQYGYYVLPVLYGSRFVARFEPEPAARAGALRVRRWWWEPGVRPGKGMLEAIEAAMARFAGFLGVPVAPESMDAVRAAPPG